MTLNSRNREKTMDDHYQLHDLVARYSDAVSRRDEAAFSATWAADARWQLPGMPETQGRDNIVALWLGVMDRFPFVLQRMNNGTVEIDGNTGSGRWYLSEHIGAEDGSVMVNIGVYQDRYIRADSGWVFSERHFSMLFHERRAASDSVIVSPYPQLI
jgi:ketosteroid isomerase-like protein